MVLKIGYTVPMIQFRQSSDPDVASLPRDRYDIVTKDALHRFPEDILRTVLGHTDFEFLGFEESELTRVEVRRTDSLIKVGLGDDVVLVHIEFQVGDSAPLAMVRRNVGYLSRCYEKYGLPILSHVIYLRPNAGRRDPGGCRQEVPGYRFIVEYKVIRLSELQGQSVLETENTGLLPFAPLMQPPPGTPPLQWAIACNRRTKRLSLPTEIRSNLLVSQWVLSGLIHPHPAIGSFLSEAVMRESSVYQHLVETAAEERYQQGIEQGIEQGAKETTIESILLFLDTRFEANTAETLKPTLEAIEDLQRLKHLLREAMRTQSLEVFTRTLTNNGNVL